MLLQLISKLSFHSILKSSMPNLSHQLALMEQMLTMTMKYQRVVMTKKKRKVHQSQQKMIFNKKLSLKLDKISPIGLT